MSGYDIEANVAALLRALKRDDEAAGLAAMAKLAALVIGDLHRMANALETIAAKL